MPLDAKKPVAFTTGFSNHPRTNKARRPNQATPMLDEHRNEGKEKEPEEHRISWTWRGDDFVKVNPGAYEAICVRWIAPNWIPAYRRYGFRLVFYLVAEGVELTMFINFGAKPQPPKSIASRYFQAWTIANGAAPRRDQPMIPDVFVEEGLLYTIEVEDAKIDPTTKKDKPPCLVYSRVKEILNVTRR